MSKNQISLSTRILKEDMKLNDLEKKDRSKTIKDVEDSRDELSENTPEEDNISMIEDIDDALVEIDNDQILQTYHTILLDRMIPYSY